MKRLILALFILAAYYQLTSGHFRFDDKSKPVSSAKDICPIKIGESVPEIFLRNVDGEPENILELTKQKQTVLVFYRGGWCPFCNLQLADLNLIENKIRNLGYQIVAVSIDKPEKLKESLGKHKLNYTLLSDSKAEASIAFGLAFKVEDEYNKMLKNHNMDIEEASGEDHHILPVPAVFIVDSDGIIQFSYVNPDYKVRLNGEILLKAAEEYSNLPSVK
jgi:peroxiredoxin